MIRSFRDGGTEDIFTGRTRSGPGRPALGFCGRSLGASLSSSIRRDVSRICVSLQAIGSEALKKDRRGQHSIRINDQYRVCFTWTEAGPTDVEITDYHE
jgi:proteic killer suppression protein